MAAGMPGIRFISLDYTWIKRVEQIRNGSGSQVVIGNARPGRGKKGKKRWRGNGDHLVNNKTPMRIPVHTAEYYCTRLEANRRHKLIEKAIADKSNWKNGELSFPSFVFTHTRHANALLLSLPPPILFHALICLFMPA